MATQFLDKIGLSHFYDKLKEKFQEKGTYLTSIPVASTSTYGAIKLYSNTKPTVIPNNITTTGSRNYALQLNSNGQAFVNVPWTDTNTTYSVATTTANGLMSSTDKTKLNIVSNDNLTYLKNLNSLFVNAPALAAIIIEDTYASTTASTFKLNFSGKSLDTSFDSISKSVDLPMATTSASGIMSSTDKSTLEGLKYIQILGSSDGIPMSVQEDSNNNLYFNLPITSYVSNSGWIESDTPAKYTIPVAEPYTGLTGTGKSGIVTKEDKNAIEKIKKENLLTTDTTISYYLNKLYFVPHSITPGSISNPQQNRIQIPEVTTTQNGLMSATDKTKLNNINTGIKGRIFLDLIDDISIKKVTDGYGNNISHRITASSISNNGFILSNIPTQLRPSLSSTKQNVEVSQVNGSNWLFSDGYVEIAACGAFNTTSQLVIRLKPGSNTSQTGLCITIYNI